jgi:hypothetical protein
MLVRLVQTQTRPDYDGISFIVLVTLLNGSPAK